jgi:hypothetical protein
MYRSGSPLRIRTVQPGTVYDAPKETYKEDKRELRKEEKEVERRTANKERNEKVRDSVRKTDVDVERLRKEDLPDD